MNRRIALKTMTRVGIGAGVAALVPFSSSVFAAGTAVRTTLPSPGSAGSVWRPLIEQQHLAQGIDIDWITADPGKMQVQLAAGALDVGVFGSVGLSTLVNKGSDIVLFGPALNNHGRWLVKADSPYKSPHDLVGKKLASTPETTETYQQAVIAAHLSGLDLAKDFKIVHGSPTANLALFERGDVDGIITLEPTASRLVANGAREIARVADIWDKATGQTRAPFLVGLAATRKWLDANHDKAVRLVKVFTDVNTYIHDHPQSLTAIATQIGLKPSETKAAALLPQRLEDTYATAWDNETFSVIDKQIEVAASLGMIARVPPRKIYTQL